MPDPQQQEPDGEDYTVTLTGHVTDEAWDHLASYLQEIRAEQ